MSRVIMNKSATCPLVIFLYGLLLILPGVALGEKAPSQDTVNPFFFYSKAFEEPPYWAKKTGQDEWQLWVFNRGTRSEGSHGRLYRGEKEVLGKQNGEILECHIGRFVWRGGYEERVHNWDHSGWQPADPDKVKAEMPTCSPFSPDYRPWISSATQEMLHLSWRTNPDGLPQGRYGALRVNDRWIFGQTIGERIKVGDSPVDNEYVWHGDLNQPGFNAGWLTGDDAANELYDPPKQFANQKPDTILTEGQTQWRAWFRVLAYKCPICADIKAYGELIQGGREVIGTKRGQTRQSELGLFIWTPEDGWLPEDTGLYLVEDCGSDDGSLNKVCPTLRPDLPSVNE